MKSVTVSSKPYTVLEAINWATELLEKNSVSDARLNAEIILRYILNLPQTELFLNYHQPVSFENFCKFQELVKERARRKPLQYILGSQVFMGLEFIINPSVFIPRFETETLVETVIKKAENLKGNKIIVDVGTGCGAIAISLAKFVSDCLVYALDISKEALKVAEANVKRHQVESKVITARGDLFEPLEKLRMAKKVDIIAANLPYIPTEHIQCLEPEIKLYEPKISLDGGKDGLDFFRRLATESVKFLKGDGFVICEIGLGQKEAVSEIFACSGQFSHTEVIADLSGTERVVIAYKNCPNVQKSQSQKSGKS